MNIIQTPNCLQLGYVPDVAPPCINSSHLGDRRSYHNSQADGRGRNDAIAKKPCGGVLGATRREHINQKQNKRAVEHRQSA